MRWLPGLVVASAALLDVRPAEACSPPMCWPGAFLPGDGTTIPQNAPGLYWRPAYNLGDGPPVDPSTVRLTAVGDPTPLPFTPTRLANGDYVLAPGAPFVQGTSYVLEDTASCGGTAGPRVTFTAGPSAPLPTTLGTLTSDPQGLRGDIDVATASGSCSTKVDAIQFTVSLSPSASAEPWMPLFLFETFVDGEPWRVQGSITTPPPPGSSWEGRARDLLWRACTTNPDASYPGLLAGPHQVAFRATLPQTTATLVTPPLGVELVCSSLDPPDPDEHEMDGGCGASTGRSSLLLLVGLLLLRRARR